MLIYLSPAVHGDLVVVGGSRGVCSGASVTLQCTLTGDILIWNKPDGDINLVRGHSTTSGSGTYQWELVELDNTLLQSSLTFTFLNHITINCTDNEAYTSSITIYIEGNTSSIT